MKIAFCFLIRKDIHQLQLWESFFKNIPKEKYGIYIHTKENSQQAFVNQYQIPERTETKRSFNLTNAISLLYKYAIKDNCYKYILLSETTIPIHSFDYVYKHITHHEKSHIQYCPRLPLTNQDISTNKMQYQRFINNYNRCTLFAKHIDIAHWYFNEMWTVLNKQHAELIVQDNVIKTYFKNAFAWDENYPMYMISLHDKGLQNVSREYVTFIDWSRAKGTSDRHPFEYNSITKNELQHMRKNPKTLFARKFSIKCNLSSHIHYLLSTDNDNDN